MKIQVVDRRNKQLAAFDLPSQTPVTELQALLHRAQPKFPPEQQRLSIDGAGGVEVLQPGKTLADYPALLNEGATVLFKDLGPQISWRTVFLIEYAGPLLLYPLLFGVAILFHGPWSYSWVQSMACLCWVLHYLKRELETLFVHVFSKGTMPLRNVFKNSGYYWGAAIINSLSINRPGYSDPATSLVLLGEAGNLACHLILANLRADGSKERKIPHGFLFEYVTSPNYTCEILAWIGFSVMTQSWAAYLFTVAGAAQMVIWANGKHRLNRKMFNGKDAPLYPPERKVLVPFIY